MGNFSTDFLFPTSGFLIGMATVANLAGNSYIYNYSKNGEEADARALRNDFAMVGKDIRHAISEFNKPTKQLEFQLS